MHGINEKCNRRFYVKNLRVSGNVTLKEMCEKERRATVEGIHISWNGVSWRPVVNTLLKN
jgi:hypothetical protein